MSKEFGSKVGYGQTASLRAVNGEYVEVVLRGWDDVGLWVVAYDSLRWYPWTAILSLQPNEEAGTENS